MRQSRASVGGGLVVVLWLCGALPVSLAAPSDGVTLQDALKRIVAKVKEQNERVEMGGIKSIVIGSFANEFNSNVTSAPEVRRVLGELLAKEGIKSESAADYAISGNLVPKPEIIERKDETEFRRSAVDIEWKLVKKGSSRPLFNTAEYAEKLEQEKGKAAAEKYRQEDQPDRPRVTDTNSAFYLKGGAVSVPTDKPKQQQYDKVRNQQEKPQQAVVPKGKTRLQVEGYPYFVEICVAKSSGEGQSRTVPPLNAYVPREITLKMIDGQQLPFVALEPGEVYAVRVYNEDQYDTAVELRIDGLNMYQFSEDGKNLSGYTIFDKASDGQASSGLLPGWHRRRATASQNQETFDTFLVTDYATGSTAQALKNPAEVGSITVGFRKAWERGQPLPPGEGGVGLGELETKPGPPVDAPFTRVQRDVGCFRGGLTIRYDRP